MSKLGKILLGILVGLVVLLIVATSATIGWRPIIGPKARALTDRKFEVTPQRLERGRYLFNSLTLCVDCHSPHDLKRPDHPIQTGMEGAGELMPVDDLPGRVVAPNITPDPQTGAGTWTDDQLARAIREGIGHDGRTLFPMMPYENFKHLSDEDLASLVVYMRSLRPVRNELPKTEIIFPVKYLIRSVPKPITAPVSAPDPGDRLKWGAYLVKVGNCADCHTPADKGQPLPGLDFAGGQVFNGAWGRTVSANITPDASGIGYYDEALFIQVLRTGYVKARKLDALMPVEQYKGLSDDDLKAMYAYVRTLKPVKHRVDNAEPPTFCKLCRAKHGAGDQN
ncbi:MAG: c-type cytochrome [Acidobacteriia bacterium]|nr:c-type cytochrome [Terriglobia bacterium]